MVPEGLQKPRRVAFLAPVALAAIGVIAAAVFAFSHLAVKGPGEHKDASPAQTAANETPPLRDQYNLDDFAEPKAK